jgi:endonuclease/exonuclease/phosphatase family metal-dependent hydrolase
MTRGRGRRSAIRGIGEIVAATVLSLALTATPATASRSSAASPVDPATTPGRRVAPVELRLMEFNIEYGGTLVRFESVVDAIRAADADVVAIEESWGNVPRLADALGYHYDVRLQVVSRYPLIDPPGAAGRYLFVQLAPGEVVAIGNVHLPSGPYSPNLIRRGASRHRILEIERRVRLPAVRPSVEALAGLVDAGIPAFLMGDFNAPSHRDWTAATVGLRPHLRYPVHWPVSAYVERTGFSDTFRDAKPDPVADEGITWPSGRPPVDGWNPGPNAPRDRIDFVYAAGAVQTLESALVGEGDGPGVEIPVDPWPSDHRAIVSTVSVQPGTPPTFVAPGSRLVEAGAVLPAIFHASGAADAAVVVTRPRDDVPLVTVPIGGSVDGSVDIATDGLEPGGYRLWLQTPTEVLSASRFWVAAPGAGPIVSVASDVVRVGHPILVRWANAPGQRWDWIGVYRRGADPNVAPYLTWFYTGASIQGTGRLDASSEGPWPLPPGRYSVYLLADDGYDVLAGADLRIVR